jgi:hypothetical protein
LAARWLAGRTRIVWGKYGENACKRALLAGFASCFGGCVALPGAIHPNVEPVEGKAGNSVAAVHRAWIDEDMQVWLTFVEGIEPLVLPPTSFRLVDHLGRIRPLERLDGVGIRYPGQLAVLRLIPAKIGDEMPRNGWLVRVESGLFTAKGEKVRPQTVKVEASAGPMVLDVQSYTGRCFSPPNGDEDVVSTEEEAIIHVVWNRPLVWTSGVAPGWRRAQVNGESILVNTLPGERGEWRAKLSGNSLEFCGPKDSIVASISLSTAALLTREAKPIHAQSIAIPRHETMQ